LVPSTWVATRNTWRIISRRRFDHHRFIVPILD
jgi:hypothetical protein